MSSPTRLRAFSDHGDLAALGDFRYAFARRDGSQTAIVLALDRWISKALRAVPPRSATHLAEIRAMFRDAPASRRLLSCFEHGLPYSLTLYQVERLTATELRTWYESALVAAGWTIVPAKPSHHADGSQRTANLVAPREPGLAKGKPWRRWPSSRSRRWTGTEDFHF